MREETQIVVSRPNAKAAGLLHYFTGKPCKRGHFSPRNVNDSGCLACKNLQAKERYVKNPDTHIAFVKQSRARKPEKYKNYQQDYQRRNLGLYRFHCAKRRTAKLNATPLWTDLTEIKRIYRDCPEGYVVDHELPLQGKNVCGLHVPWNLQYLTEEENVRKHNKVSV